MLLRQLARHAQLVEDRRIGRVSDRVGSVEIPERAIGGVVERELLIGAEHGDAGRRLIKRPPVRVDQPRERIAHRFGFGGVDAEPALPVSVRISSTSKLRRVASDDRRQPARIGAVPVRARLRDGFARGAIEQFEVPLDGVGCILGFDRPRIGGIDEGEPPDRVARPCRRRQRFDQRAQGGDLGEQFLDDGL